MPKGLCQLKELNYLERFLVGDDGICGVNGWTIGCNMEELENLSKLRRLSIHNLERASTGTPAVKNKSFLKHVRWHFCESETGLQHNYTVMELRKMEKVLEELVPPRSLEELVIANFPGCRYPSWMLQASLISFHRLEYVVLLYCISWKEAPPLGQLPQLKSLDIRDAYAIVTVGSEFLCCHMSKAEGAFPKLETLQFWGMENWEDWLLDGNDLASEGRGAASKLLPRLTELQLCFCPKLRYLPTGLGHATCLKELIISECDSLKEVKNLPSLYKLIVINCGGLQRISDLPLLGNLDIDRCPRLTDVANLDTLDSLKLLYNSEDEEAERMEQLPEWLGGLAEQQLQISWVHDTPTTSTSTAMQPPLHLQIFNCSPFLLRRCLKGGEDWHIIQKFPQVNIYIHYKYGAAGEHVEYMMYTRTPPTYTTNLWNQITAMDPDPQV